LLAPVYTITIIVALLSGWGSCGNGLMGEAGAAGREVGVVVETRDGMAMETREVAKEGTMKI